MINFGEEIVEDAKRVWNKTLDWAEKKNIDKHLRKGAEILSVAYMGIKTVQAVKKRLPKVGV